MQPVGIREMEKTKPIETVSTPAPLASSRSCLQPALPLVARMGPAQPAESSMSISYYSSDGQMGIRRDYFKLLLDRTSGMDKSDVSTSESSTGGGGDGE